MATGPEPVFAFLGDTNPEEQQRMEALLRGNDCCPGWRIQFASWHEYGVRRIRALGSMTLPKGRTYVRSSGEVALEQDCTFWCVMLESIAGEEAAPLLELKAEDAAKLQPGLEVGVGSNGGIFTFLQD